MRAARFPAGAREISRIGGAAGKTCGVATVLALAQSLPIEMASITVLRLAVSSIVLTLAIGPYGSLLCRTVCPPQPTTADVCHDDNVETSAVVAGSDDCRALVIEALFLREDLRRAAPAPDQPNAIVVSAYRLAPVTGGDRSGRGDVQVTAADNRPRETALRL